MRLARFLLTAWLLPFLLGLFVYFGFATDYTRGVFSVEGFKWQYESGIYRYRVLGRWLLLELHGWIERNDLAIGAPRSLPLLDGQGTPEFYTAYFVLNTLCICLACSAWFWLPGRSAEPVRRQDQQLLLVALLMSLTQYVVVPYDALSYLWLVMAFAISTGRPTWTHTAALGAATALAALTRETAVLIPAFYLALQRREILGPGAILERRVALAVAAGSVVATYGALRLVFGVGEATFWADPMLAYNLTTWAGQAGLAFAIAGVALFWLDPERRQDCAWFTVLCLPYLLGMVFVASAWEVRLWVPVLLGLLALQSGAARPSEPAAAHRGGVSP